MLSNSSGTAARDGVSGRGPWRLAVGILAIALCALTALLAVGGGARARAEIPGVSPARWPTTLQLGVADAPGGATALAASAPFGFRYQYLTGGVNTGGGWSTWNAGGSFVTAYIEESIASGVVPVFSYYQLRPSAPGSGMGEAAGDLANLQNLATMTAYFTDLKLFFQKAGAFPTSLVVLHHEPDAWGFIEQAAPNNLASDVPVQVAATGLPELVGLPNTAVGLAQAVKRLRDRFAPNVALGYHTSIWGTGDDILYSKPADATVIADAQKAAAFYQSLGAAFDLTFAEASDRDAAFKQYNYGDGGASWWGPDDYRRHLLWLQTYHAAVPLGIVEWQLPLGNTKMRAQNNTWHHYQDNHVEWLLDDPTRARLLAYQRAGVVALLFGPGAEGATCACDAAHDGVTNPTPINGNTAVSLNADDDGGYFRQQAQLYSAAGALPLGGESASPTAAAPTPTASAPLPTATPSPIPTPGAAPSPSPSPTPVTTGPAAAASPPDFTTSAQSSAATALAGTSVGLSAIVRSGAATVALVDLEVYSAGGQKVFQQFWDNQTLEANGTHSFSTNWPIPAGQAAGVYTVKVGVFSPGWGRLYSWNDAAAQLTVQALQAGLSTSASVTPAGLVVGGSVTIVATVSSAATVSALVDVEVYGPGGQRQFQQFWDNQSLTPEQARSVSATWTAPPGLAAGTYVVKVGVFSPGWGALYLWNDSAAVITVQ